jgi:hypothetical protein
MKPIKTNIRDSNLAAKYQTPGQLTTVMIRNVPCEYTQDDLIEEVSERLGCQDLFDFFYLPWDTPNNANIGYAFVNFKDTTTAQRAVQVFSNYRFKNCQKSRKVAKVLAAHIQGLENNLRHLQDRAVVHGNHQCTPVVMWNGAKIELSQVFEEFHMQAVVQERLNGGDKMGPPGLQQPPSMLAHHDHISDFCEMMDRAAGLRMKEPRNVDASNIFEDSIPRPAFGSSTGGARSDLYNLMTQSFLSPSGALATESGPESSMSGPRRSMSNGANPVQAFIAQSGLEFARVVAPSSAPGRLSSHFTSGPRFKGGLSMLDDGLCSPSHDKPPDSSHSCSTSNSTSVPGSMRDFGRFPRDLSEPTDCSSLPPQGSWTLPASVCDSLSSLTRSLPKASELDEGGFEDRFSFADIKEEAVTEIAIGHANEDVLRKFLDTFKEAP